MNLLRNSVLLLTLGLGLTTHAHAGIIYLSADGEWSEFSVDDFSSVSQGVEWIDTTDSNSPEFGSTLTYQFTIATGFKGHLSVVDAGFAGDRFEIFNNGLSIGITSETSSDIDYSNNFESNLASTDFSKHIFTLTEGTYNITGGLFSTLQPFNATNGALKLDVTPVPVSGTLGLLFIGLSIITLARRRF